MNWNEILVRCSSLYCLFTPPKSKEDKLAGNLSETAKTHLNKLYVEYLWGKKRQVTTKQMEKGTICEPEGIVMISAIDGIEYVKNEERKSDQYITGEPDIISENEIIDVKSCWDAESFIPNLVDGISSADFYQMQGYMRLWNKPQARVRKCLISAPLEILKKELFYLFNKMDVATTESPEYIMAAAELNFNLTFDEIPIEHRVIDILVPRDESIIEQIPSKVAKAREYLAELHELHMKQNKPILVTNQ